jgi:hypothetical protein
VNGQTQKRHANLFKEELPEKTAVDVKECLKWIVGEHIKQTLGFDFKFMVRAERDVKKVVVISVKRVRDIDPNALISLSLSLSLSLERLQSAADVRSSKQSRWDTVPRKCWWSVTQKQRNGKKRRSSLTVYRISSETKEKERSWCGRAATYARRLHSLSAEVPHDRPAGSLSEVRGRDRRK